MKTTLTAPSGFKSLCGQGSLRQIGWALAFAGTLVAGKFALRYVVFPPSIRWLVVLVPLVVGVLYMSAMVRDLRRQVDELQVRIYLEAAAVAVCGLFLIMLMYPMFEEARVLPSLDSSTVMALLVLLVTGGYVNAKRRYR